MNKLIQEYIGACEQGEDGMVDKTETATSITIPDIAGRAEIELLAELQPVIREILWIAHVWNDHNFDEIEILNKAKKISEKLGVKTHEDANDFLKRFHKVLGN